jgi:hypothetical protein
MLVALLPALSLSRDLFFNTSAPSAAYCGSPSGCNVANLNASISIGDRIFLVEPVLSGQQARDFLLAINSTTSRNISLIGAPTLISDPGFRASDNPAIYLENSSITLANLSFELFGVPVLNGMSSHWNLTAVSFLNSKVTVAPFLAFVNSSVRAAAVNISGNTANSQSLVVAVHSSFSFSDFSLARNFMDSKDVRAAIHVVNSELLFDHSGFELNTMELPMIAGSNASRVVIRESSFFRNHLFAGIAMEFDSFCEIKSSFFLANSGSIVVGGQNSRLAFESNLITNQTSEEMLIGLTDANVSIVNASFVNSSIAGVLFVTISNETFSYMTSIADSLIRRSSSKMPLFAGVGGTFSIRNCTVSLIQSAADIVALSYQNGVGATITDSKFIKLSSTSPVSTMVSILNCSAAVMENVKFSKSISCAALCENATVSVKKSNFTMNQCFPRGNSIPLAILTASIGDHFRVEDSIFSDNTALTGSLFVMNVTGEVRNSIFQNNQAVQGAGLFSVGSDISVVSTAFSGNNAMTLGGAASVSAGNVTFDKCDFIGNAAGEGAGISAKEMLEFHVLNGKVKRNNSTNGTFINAEGPEMKLAVNNIKFDDEFAKAVVLGRPDLADFSGSKFNCRLRCQTVSFAPVGGKVIEIPTKTPTPTEDWDLDVPDTRRRVSVFWAAFPVCFLLAVGVLFASRRNSLRKLLARLRLKGRHNL